VHHLDSWIKIDQLDVTCFIISQFTAQHVSNVSISIFRSLRLIVDLFHGLYCSGSMYVGVTVWFGLVVWYPYAGFSIRIPHHSINSKIIKQVTSSWSMFIQTCISFQVQCPLCLSYFDETWIFSEDFREILTPNFTKFCPVWAEIFHADRRTDRHDEAK